MSKLTILAAAGVGYVLGARAGRERYDQLRQTFEKVKNDPRVQEKAQQATAAVKENAPAVAEAVKEKAGEAAGAAKQKVSSGSSPSTGSGTSAGVEAKGDGALNPDRLKLAEDTGPQGTLP